MRFPLKVTHLYAELPYCNKNYYLIESSAKGSGGKLSPWWPCGVAGVRRGLSVPAGRGTGESPGRARGERDEGALGAVSSRGGPNLPEARLHHLP